MRKKRKIKYFNVMLLILVVVLIGFSIFNLIGFFTNFLKGSKDDSNELTKVTESENLDVKKNEEYSDDSIVESNEKPEVLDVESFIKNNFEIGMSIEDATSLLDKKGIGYNKVMNYSKNPQSGLTDIRLEGNEVLVFEDTKLTKDDILWLQEQLKIASYYTVIDGSYGDGTKSVMDRYTEEKLGVTFKNYNSFIKDSLVKNNKDRLSGDINDFLVLVNKKTNLLSSDAPENLVDITVSRLDHAKYVTSETNEQLEKMFSDAKKENINLRVVSGYRSFDLQATLFERYKNKSSFEEANKYSALPGQSEHQTGLVVDVDDGRLEYTLKQSFDETEAYKWLDNNAHKYGFILRYPKDKQEITGYIYEPWHYRYVGSSEVAKEIKEQSISLEEYLKGNN